jgi:uncharacterized DUF497 family protein
MKFEWDARKEASNIAKHGIDFTEAQEAFRDSRRLIFLDVAHSGAEVRFFCIGRTGRGILTVRFTYRVGGALRIIGAGYWRKGKRVYEKTNR